jgi:hypothetical protein
MIVCCEIFYPKFVLAMNLTLIKYNASRTNAKSRLIMFTIENFTTVCKCYLAPKTSQSRSKLCVDSIMRTVLYLLLSDKLNLWN